MNSDDTRPGLEGVPLLVVMVLGMGIATVAFQSHWQLQFSDAVLAAGIVTILGLTVNEAIGG